MRRLILLFLFDVLISSAVAAWLYFTRGEDAALTTGLSLFIACSPICLILAEPFTLYLVGRRLAKLGVKLNKPNALGIVPDIEVVAMSYNRVLTCNEYRITDVVPDFASQTALLTVAAGAERDATNPLGQAIYATAISRAFRLPKSSNFKELPGRGVEATVDGRLIRVGDRSWLESLGTDISARLRTKIDQFLVKGKTVLVVCTGRVARGLIALKDDFNDDAKDFLAELKIQKMETLLLTAMPRKMANRIGKEFLIDHVRTNLTPEGKAREVQIFRAKGKLVAAIGTDIHDLLALGNADVSFMLTGGTLETAELETKPDFELSTLENFLTVRELSLKVVNALKLNRSVALASWLVLIPPALLSAMENPPIPFNPLLAAAGVAIFGAIILANSLRMK